MAIVGKQWSAVLSRQFGLDPDVVLDGVSYVMYFDNSRTSQEEIETYYPDLAALVDYWFDSERLPYFRRNFLQQNSPPAGNYEGEGTNLTYDSAGDEVAMLDTALQNPATNLAGNYARGANANQNHLIWWDGVEWLTGGIGYETPSAVWALNPDAPTYAETEAAPFGTGLGNGTIRYQVLTWTPDNAIFIQAIPGIPPSPSAPVEFSAAGYTVAGCDLTYIFTPVDDGAPDPDPDPEPLPPGLVDDDIRVRVWGHKLDGHTFYHLRIGDERGTLTFDLTTGQWAEYASPDETRWRPHVGCNWVGMAATVNLGGSDIVCGDDTTGTLWVLDPTAGTDDDASTGAATRFERVVTGGIPLDGRETAPCGAVTLSLALGNPIGLGATIELETSDDLGNNFTSQGTQEVTADDFGLVVEFRGLGLMRPPGRIFRFTDTGATVRLSAADLR